MHKETHPMDVFNISDKKAAPGTFPVPPTGILQRAAQFMELMQKSNALVTKEVEDAKAQGKKLTSQIDECLVEIDEEATGENLVQELSAKAATGPTEGEGNLTTQTVETREQYIEMNLGLGVFDAKGHIATGDDTDSSVGGGEEDNNEQPSTYLEGAESEDEDVIKTSIGHLHASKLIVLDSKAKEAINKKVEEVNKVKAKEKKSEDSDEDKNEYNFSELHGLNITVNPKSDGKKRIWVMEENDGEESTRKKRK